MRLTLVLLATIAIFGWTAGITTAQVNHRDPLDAGYVPGPWATQGGWTEWDGSVDVNGLIDASNFAFTGSQSGLIIGDIGGSTGLGDDMVWDYVNLPGGQPGGGGIPGTRGKYVFSIMTYVQSGSIGLAWVIMLNQYPVTKNWSLQCHLDSDNGLVHPVEPGTGADVPLIYDEWVAFIVCIDLDNDIQHIYYGDDLVDSGPWVGNGIGNIAAVDLYADEPGTPGTSGTWFDNHRLEQVGAGNQSAPCVALNIRPSKVTGGDAITVKTQSPILSSTPYGFLMTEINGVPVAPTLVFVAALDGTGQSTIPGVVPPGIPPGLSVSFKSLVANPAGLLAKSNTFEIVFQ